MEIFKIIGIAFVIVVCIMLIKNTKPELAFAVTVAGSVIIASYAIDLVFQTFSVFAQLTEIGVIDSSLVKLILKMIGIGYMVEFSANILRDFGGESVADKVVLCGKLTILSLSVPLIQTLINLLKKFLELI